VSSAPLSPEAAREIVLGEVLATAAETVSLESCLDRFAAAPSRAGTQVPPFDNSAMDGFALRAEDTLERRPLRLVGESRAGRPADLGPGPGEAVRISTGAALPAGADAVLPIEIASEAEGRVTATRPVACGENVRRAGEDIEAGQQLLEVGARIGPAELGVLASVGLATVECARRPSVAVLTSGDELAGPGRPLGPGQIHDSSRFSLPALALRAGAEPTYAGALPDDPASIEASVAAVLDADFLVVVGGVSVGPHDHVKAVFDRLGVEQRFWRVALRPGGPTWFGVRRSSPAARPTLVFGLPGNPVSSMVTFHLFVRAALLKASGCDPDLDRSSAVFAQAYRKPPGKAHYLRCRLEATNGERRAVPTTERQGSHVLSSMLNADCLAVIPAAGEGVEAGERVEVRLL
jgi:molybdopterin molybdotransferase